MSKCFNCRKEIKPRTYVCPHCGEELVPEDCRLTEATMEEVKRLLAEQNRPQKKIKEPMFTEEEAFMMHIHPDDKTYRDIMRMNILSKDYRKK